MIIFCLTSLQDVHPNSPAQQAGLLAHSDYIIGADSVLHESEDLFTLVEAHEGRQLKLYVYNTESDACREVTITPNSQWGGEGSLGCGIGYGYLHRIPLRLGVGRTAPVGASTMAEKTPLLMAASDIADEVNNTTEMTKAVANPLELGASPTVPTLPTQPAQPSTLQVRHIQIAIAYLFSINQISSFPAGHIWSAQRPIRRLSPCSAATKSAASCGSYRSSTVVNCIRAATSTRSIDLFQRPTGRSFTSTHPTYDSRNANSSSIDHANFAARHASHHRQYAATTSVSHGRLSSSSRRQPIPCPSQSAIQSGRPVNNGNIKVIYIFLFNHLNCVRMFTIFPFVV